MTIYEGSASAWKILSLEKQKGMRRMPSSGKLRRVALVKTDVSEEPNAYKFFVACVGY
jgi:hypothetical protein